MRHPIHAAPLVLALGLTAACAAPPPPEPPAPPPPAVDFPYADVWTARPGVRLVSEAESVVVPHPFSRLQVLRAGPDELLVRCLACPDPVEGRVGRTDVVYAPLPPDRAAGRSLAEFALAVRAAAERRDLSALRPVMTPGFSFSFVGRQGPTEAFAAWSDEDFRSLARVPDLLDRGLATRDSLLWAAPPEHFERIGYRGPRLGFRRSPAGRWEWLFLVSGMAEG